MHLFRHKVRMFLDHRTAWMWIMGAALLVRAIVAWQMYDVPLEGDSLYYYQVAQDMAAGEAFSTYWPPGLPLYEAAVIKVVGAGHFTMRLAMMLWFLLFARLLYNLLNRMHSRIAANIGLIAVAFYPAFVFQSLEPLTQMPTAALVMALFFGLYRYLHRRRRWLWYIGVALGLVILFRPSASLFFLLVPSVIFWESRKIIATGLAALIALGMVASWVWVASENSGRFVPINEANSRNFYLGNNAWTPNYKTWQYGSHWTYWKGHPEGFRKQLAAIEAMSPEDRSASFLKAGFTQIGNHPEIFLLRTVNRLRVYFSFDSFTGSHLIAPPRAKPLLGYASLVSDGIFFTSIGLGWLAFVFGLARQEVESKYMRLSYAFVVIYTLPYLISFSHPSYHFPIVPLLLLPGAVLLAKTFLDRTFTWRVGWKWRVAAILFLLVQLEWILRMTVFK